MKLTFENANRKLASDVEVVASEIQKLSTTSVFMKDISSYQKALLDLSNIYRDNSLFFSKRINNKIYELISFLTAYFNIYIFVIGLVDNYLNKNKEKRKIVNSDMLYIFDYAFNDKLNKLIGDIQKIILKELSNNSYKISKQNKSPANMDFNEKTIKKLSKYIDDDIMGVLSSLLREYLEVLDKEKIISKDSLNSLVTDLDERFQNLDKIFENLPEKTKAIYEKI